MSAITLRTATEQDASAIRGLLQREGLPTSDLDSARPDFVLACDGADVIGTGALQPFGDTALVRSVAVSADRRGLGIGGRIVRELEQRAQQMGIRDLVLLTQTATGFFEHQGYRIIPRESVGAPVQQSDEFRLLCPATATCMSKSLTGAQASHIADKPYKVLVLCTGNSARSILAEALINHLGAGRFRGFSAGSHPKGAVHPLALDLLKEMGLPTQGLRSKSWDEFAPPGAASLDFVFTVCDNAAGEACPYWPGQPIKAHWGLPDPAAVEGSDADRRRAFRAAFQALESRVRMFMSLPIASLDRSELQQRLKAIGTASSESNA